MLPAFAANSDDLKKVQKELEEKRRESAVLKARSENLQKEAKALRAQLIALSQSVQQREANVTRLENAIQALSAEEQEVRVKLEAQHGQSVEALMAIQRLALNPPEAIIAMPQDPADMVRSAVLLRSVVPHLQEQATTLQAQVGDYVRKRELLEDQKRRLAGANTNLDDERRRLNAMIADKKALSRRYLGDSKKASQRVASLSKKAKNLKGLLVQIEKERKAEEKRKAAAAKARQAKPAVKAPPANDNEIVLGKPPTGVAITKSKGRLSKPAAGPVVMTYGQQEKLGGKHKGISIKTRRGAQIVATYDGQIAFAGPFRGYKQLLIIDHGHGYHTLLTGMDRIDVSVGQWLLSGEPVAVMPSAKGADDSLYFELRKNGAPINPLPWIGQRNAKARG